MMHTRLMAGVVLAALALAGCGRVPPLAHTQESAEATVAAVLDALATRDRARLAALALSEQEFKDHVWPDLPASRPERNLPFSYVWGDLHQKSDGSLGQTLRILGGRRLTLVEVRFKGKTDYPRSTVHREAVAVVRGEDGTVRDVRVCGSLIEQDGRWKVFSYVTND